jgi:hypothetical protein
LVTFGWRAADMAGQDARFDLRMDNELPQLYRYMVY